MLLRVLLLIALVYLLWGPILFVLSAVMVLLCVSGITGLVFRDWKDDGRGRKVRW